MVILVVVVVTSLLIALILDLIMSLLVTCEMFSNLTLRVADISNAILYFVWLLVI